VDDVPVEVVSADVVSVDVVSVDMSSVEADVSVAAVSAAALLPESLEPPQPATTNANDAITAATPTSFIEEPPVAPERRSIVGASRRRS
jgi:hypothetical protein